MSVAAPPRGHSRPALAPKWPVRTRKTCRSTLRSVSIRRGKEAAKAAYRSLGPPRGEGVGLRVAPQIAHTYITVLGLRIQVSNSEGTHNLVKALVALGSESLEVRAQRPVRRALLSLFLILLFDGTVGLQDTSQSMQTTQRCEKGSSLIHRLS